MKALGESKKVFLTSSTAPVRATDVMTSPVIAVDLSEPLKEVANLLLSNAISCVPVLDSDGHLQGVITEADLLAKEEGTATLARAKPFVTLSKKTRKFFQNYEGRTAGDSMTHPVITAKPATPIREIAALMRKSGINALPIVDGQIVVGIVARRDVLKVLQRSDADLAAAVRNKLTDGIGIDAKDFLVSVDEGIVTVTGNLPTKSQREHVDGYIRSLDSVIDVDLSGLSYQEDDMNLQVPYRNF